MRVGREGLRETGERKEERTMRDRERGREREKHKH